MLGGLGVRAQSFKTRTHNFSQNGKWALNPINIGSSQKSLKMPNYTLKSPLFTSKWHSKTHPTKLKEDQKSHYLILHYQGLASHQGILSGISCKKNIKLGHWIQVAYPLKIKKVKGQLPIFVFKRNLSSKRQCTLELGDCQIILTLLENIKFFEACFLESIKHSFSVLKCQAISNSIFCFLNSFLEPATIPCIFFPWSFAILITTDIILSNFFKEGYL